MPVPDLLQLTSDLQSFVEAGGVAPDPELRYWDSGVYAVLDCVFSAQARYESVVLPLLRQRFPERSGLRDKPGLTFNAFIRDVERFPEPDRFDTYARKVMGNAQQISRRTKVEVGYDLCRYFVEKELETLAEVLALPQGQPANTETGEPARPGELERMVLEELVEGHRVRGIGPALGRYLLMQLGCEHYVKPDTLLLRLLGRVGGWQPRAGHSGDIALVQEAVTAVALRMGTTPMRLDNALWQYESTRPRNATGVRSRPTPP